MRRRCQGPARTCCWASCAAARTPGPPPLRWQRHRHWPQRQGSRSYWPSTQPGQAAPPRAMGSGGLTWSLRHAQAATAPGCACGHCEARGVAQAAATAAQRGVRHEMPRRPVPSRSHRPRLMSGLSGAHREPTSPLLWGTSSRHHSRRRHCPAAAQPIAWRSHG